ncbi:hypothetical protein QVD17_03310 [Tagetes erecta]|uniref:Protein kinase domain-containing protein n=1 Tax=Tagetes erecta TaxID=13708 RepID=A0AAD8LAR3_TARER|nr:hypothetical protein QVD17_03310 [Tagetes erecta]
MEDTTANVIAIATVINLIVLIIVSRIIFRLTEPFFLILGASIAAIFAVIGFYFIRRNNHTRRRKLETIIASEGKELRIEYSFLRKVAGLPTKFRFKELEQATENWKYLIGKGASGSVFKGVLIDGTEVAVKRIQHGEERGEKEFRSEIAAIASVQHVNLVRLIGYCIQNNNLHFLVYDFIPNGGLSNWIFTSSSSVINNNFTGCLSWKQRLNVAIDVAKALAYLHHDCRSKVLHLDVKPENILLDTNYNAIVSDFGISKLMKRDDSRILTSMRGTRGYIAPEWLLGSGISEKSDVFSYGIVLLELIGGRRSVKAINVDGDGARRKYRYEYFPQIVTEKLKSGTIMEVVDQRMLDLEQTGQIDEDEVKKLVHVALWCIQHKPRRRPSMVEVVKWLEGRTTVEEPPETTMMVVDLLSIAKGEDGGWHNRNKKRKPGVVARVASQINGCLPLVGNNVSTSRSKSFTYSMSIISPR